jgi:hypothetical protein
MSMGHLSKDESVRDRIVEAFDAVQVLPPGSEGLMQWFRVEVTTTLKGSRILIAKLLCSLAPATRTK